MQKRSEVTSFVCRPGCASEEKPERRCGGGGGCWHHAAATLPLALLVMCCRSVYSGPCELIGRCDDERWTPPWRRPPPTSYQCMQGLRLAKLLNPRHSTEWLCLATTGCQSGEVVPAGAAVPLGFTCATTIVVLLQTGHTYRTVAYAQGALPHPTLKRS